MKMEFRTKPAQACIAALSLLSAPTFAATIHSDLSLGYRTDDIHWSNASDITGTATPNIESELTWTDVHSAYLRYDGWVSAAADQGWYARWGVAYGLITDGKNQDSDYAGDNRTNEISRSNNDTDGDFVNDIYIAFGYLFKLNSVSLAPYIGYSRSELDFVLTNGKQTIPATGPFPGLNSTYNAVFKGPFVGVELTVPVRTSEIFFRVERHKSDYHSEANWNLRADLAHPVSFSQDADADGTVGTIGWRYAIRRGESNKGSGIFVSYEYGKWEADPGVDHLYNANGTSVDSRLNEVVWKKSSINIGWWGRF